MLIDPLNNISNEETFIRNFLVIMRRPIQKILKKWFPVTAWKKGMYLAVGTILINDDDKYRWGHIIYLIQTIKSNDIRIFHIFNAVQQWTSQKLSIAQKHGYVSNIIITLKAK